MALQRSTTLLLGRQPCTADAAAAADFPPWRHHRSLKMPKSADVQWDIKEPVEMQNPPSDPQQRTSPSDHQVLSQGRRVAPDPAGNAGTSGREKADSLSITERHDNDKLFPQHWMPPFTTAHV